MSNFTEEEAEFMASHGNKVRTVFSQRTPCLLRIFAFNVLV